jgi:predicted alpha/beta-fold hydrolase
MIIVPGLTGNSSNLYITSVIVECEKEGYDAVVINYRCNAGLLPTVTYYFTFLINTVYIES